MATVSALVRRTSTASVTISDRERERKITRPQAEDEVVVDSPIEEPGKRRRAGKPAAPVNGQQLA